MKFALLRCCTTPIFLKQYEWSTNAVFKALGIETVDIKEFNCCGYPLRNFNFRGYVLSSARNLALAEKQNLNVITVCNCCYGSLKHAAHLMKNDGSIREQINLTLEKEDLRYDGDIEARHLLQVLYHEVGLENLKARVVNRYEGLKVATHYGCHILRPRNITEFDNPFSPTKFDELVEITGAESISWLSKLECCGSPLWGINEELSLDLTEKKLLNAKQAGADYLCTACSYCQLQFDRVQRVLLSQRRNSPCRLPSILYPQLLGLSLGIDAEVLGLKMNEVSVGPIEHFLSEKVELEAMDAPYENVPPP